MLGLIGLGLVGSALVERFRAKGFEIAGYDIDPEKMKTHEGEGFVACKSPAEVADRAVGGLGEVGPGDLDQLLVGPL